MDKEVELYIEKHFSIYLCFKRVFDILCSLIGIIFIIPISLLVKIIYVLNKDYNTIFYTQKRIGKNGKIFKLYKYRTMVPDADKVLDELLKTQEYKLEWDKYKKLSNDPRITRIGNILRKTSLDELPQLINVFMGDMSLIGPRPYLPREKEDMGEYYDSIISTKPGLTGYWQVNGRNDTTSEERLKLESFYSSNVSLKLDLKIFFKTFKVVLFGKGAK